MSFTKIQFCLITVHAEDDDLVEVVRLLDEHDKFLLFEIGSFHSTCEYFCHNLPGIRVFESLLDSQRKPALFVVPEESWFAHFLSCGSEFLEHLKFFWVKRFHNGSPRSIMTEGRQAFFFSVIGSSTARCIFSLLGEESALPMVMSSYSKSFGDPFSTEDSWMCGSVASVMW